MLLSTSGTLDSLEMFGTTVPMTQDHIPEDKKARILDYTAVRMSHLAQPQRCRWTSAYSKNCWKHTLCGESSSDMSKEVNFLHHTYHAFLEKALKHTRCYQWFLFECSKHFYTWKYLHSKHPPFSTFRTLSTQLMLSKWTPSITLHKHINIRTNYGMEKTTCIEKLVLS
jgi:hypothetical protein